MSEIQEGIQMAMLTGQAMAFTIEKGTELTREILMAMAKLLKVSVLYAAPKIKNAWKKQPGAVSMEQIRNRVPVRINEADQQKFFDWMHKAQIPYCPLEDFNTHDQYAEFIVDAKELPRLQSIVDRNQKEFSMKDFQIITWEDYAMNHVTEEDLQNLAKEAGIDLDGAVKKAYERPEHTPSIKEKDKMKHQVFRDDFAKGRAVAITLNNEKLLNERLSNGEQTTFRIPYQKDLYVSIPKEDLIKTDEGKTTLGRLHRDKEYTIVNIADKQIMKWKGQEVKMKFDDVQRKRFTSRDIERKVLKGEKMNVNTRQIR